MKERILIVDNNTTYLKEVKKIFSNNNYMVVNFKNIKNLDLDFFTHFILTGGGESLDEEKFKDELSLIKTTNKPLLGICCGHQLICLAFNSTISRMDVSRKGLLNVKLIGEDTFFDGLNKEIWVYENHTHNVNFLGDELLGLGFSVDGIEIIKHKDKLIYGIQFHPEKSFDDLNIKKMIENFLNFS